MNHYRYLRNRATEDDLVRFYEREERIETRPRRAALQFVGWIVGLAALGIFLTWLIDSWSGGPK